MFATESRRRVVLSATEPRRTGGASLFCHGATEGRRRVPFLPGSNGEQERFHLRGLAANRISVTPRLGGQKARSFRGSVASRNSPRSVARPNGSPSLRDSVANKTPSPVAPWPKRISVTPWLRGFKALSPAFVAPWPKGSPSLRGSVASRRSPGPPWLRGQRKISVTPWLRGQGNSAPPQPRRPRQFC